MQGKRNSHCLPAGRQLREVSGDKALPTGYAAVHFKQ
jgi:hypothetical protein